MYSFILLSRIANRVPTAYDAGTRRISPHLTWHDLKSLALQLSPKTACPSPARRSALPLDVLSRLLQANRQFTCGDNESVDVLLRLSEDRVICHIEVLSGS